MPTFGKRVHAALMSSGDATVSKLASVGGFSLVTARKWLLRTDAHEDIVALFRLAEFTHTRMQWLIQGKGPVRSVRDLNSLEYRVLKILEKMTPVEAETWLSEKERQVSKET